MGRAIVTIGDDIGITGTLARIREIQAPVTGVTAPASPSAATTTAASGFAQTLAQVQTGQATVPGTASPLGAPALTPNASTAGALAYASGPPSTGTVTVGGVPMALVPLSAVNGATAATPATGTPAVVPDGAAGTAGPRGRMIAQIATAELGVREQPPGSNDGARIAEYRTATRGSGVGPWCAYFTSWVAAQAGVPIGEGGRGEGWVPSVERWGKDTGRWIPSGAETPAQAGDLIIFDRNGDGLTDHIGVVTGVRADGGLETVEGNSSDAVSRRSYRPGEWAGLVRLVPPGT
jgi:cell wall-associated NlpC family hydrolase